MTEQGGWRRVDESHHAEVYEVLSPDPLNPDYPERYRLTIMRDGFGAHFLTKDQPGPWVMPSEPIDMFVSLTDLVKLGKLAQALLDDGVPDD